LDQELRSAICLFCGFVDAVRQNLTGGELKRAENAFEFGGGLEHAIVISQGIMHRKIELDYRM
jgi:hypothetical protein